MSAKTEDQMTDDEVFQVAMSKIITRMIQRCAKEFPTKAAAEEMSDYLHFQYCGVWLPEEKRNV